MRRTTELDGCRRSRRRTFAVRGRVTITAAVAVLPVLALAACSSASSSSASGSSGGSSSGGSSKPYSLVMVADQTGALAGTFGEAPNGLQTYIDQTNAAGGINGHKLSVKVLDAESDPNSAVVAFRQAISANPTAILHAGVSSELASGQPLLTQADIPVLSASTLDTLLVPKPAPWFFSLDPTSSQFIATQLLQLKNAAGGSLQGKKVAIVLGVSASLTEQLQFAEHQYAKQYGYTYTVTNITNGISAFPQAAKIASTHPAAVLLLTIGNDTAVIVKALTSAGLKVPMVSNTTGASNAFITQVGLNNYFGLEQAPTPAPGSALLALAGKYGQGGSANNPSYSLGYAQGYLIGLALKQCGNNCDSAAVTKALETINNAVVPDGAMWEPVSFSATSHLGLGAVGFNTYDPTSKAVVKASIVPLPPVIS